MQQMWQSIQTFFLLNPELVPAGYLLLAYIGIYLVSLLMTRIIVAVKGYNKPFTDQVAHWILIVFLVSLAIVTIWWVIDMATGGVIMLLWYHWVIYVILLAVDALLAAMLIGSLLRE